MYTRAELAFLMAHDSDNFNRWEAGQKLMLEVIREVQEQIQSGKKPVVDPQLIESVRAVLADPALDKFSAAMMLSLPSHSYIAEMTDGAVYPEAIHAARLAVKQALGTALEAEFAHAYQANTTTEPFRHDGAEMARRMLMNGAMDYLAAIGKTHVAETQFAAQDNMNDVLAALTSLVNSTNLPAREAALQAFGDRWQHKPDVLEKWFRVQASSPECGTLEKVQELLRHPKFDITDPGLARAVIGGFSVNPVHFHRADGAGYAFVADQVLALNAINAKTAALLLTALADWRRYAPEHQALMKAQLERVIATPGLSGNVYEIASKSLAPLPGEVKGAANDDGTGKKWVDAPEKNGDSTRKRA